MRGLVIACGGLGLGLGSEAKPTDFLDGRPDYFCYFILSYIYTLYMYTLYIYSAKIQKPRSEALLIE